MTLLIDLQYCSPLNFIVFLYNEIDNKIIRTRTHRMEDTLFKDLLKKRQKRSMKLKCQINDPSLQSLFLPDKQLAIENIIEKLVRPDPKPRHRCELNIQEKYAIIDYISDIEKVSYNRTTLVELMTVWRQSKTSQFYQVQHTKPSQPSQLQSPATQCSFANFFVLFGEVAIFQNNDKGLIQLGEIQNTPFSTESLEGILEGRQPKYVLREGTSWGPLFKKKQCSCAYLIARVSNALVVEVRPPKSENMLINQGGMEEQRKIKALQCFPAFSAISKRLSSMLQYFELKKYYKNQFIYKIRQQPQAVYLILKGEVMLQVRMPVSPPKDIQVTPSKTHNLFSMQTQILGEKNYFGEQEIILKIPRTLSAICRSVECDLLQIPIEKFEKLFSNNTFFDEVSLCAQIKFQKRKQKIGKSIQIYDQFNKNNEKYKYDLVTEPLKPVNLKPPKKASRRRSSAPLHMTHGYAIKKIPVSRYCEPVDFSMLGVNPDMYAATLKKFRKYSIKPAEKYKPEVNWNLKRVWKVLNLQTILREQSQINCPEGRHFYDTHLRLQNHVQENKSMRPRTSSSSYRTKLQYIAYLHQFNN